MNQLATMAAHLTPLAFMDMLGGQEIMLIMVVILIFFGGDKMPGFAKGLGKVVRELKKAVGDVENEFKRAMEESEHPKPPPTFPSPISVPRPEIQAARPISIPTPEAAPPPAPPAEPPSGDHPS